MRILHACWDNSIVAPTFYLWGEDADKICSSNQLTDSNAPSKARDVAPPHPFAVPANWLRTILRSPQKKARKAGRKSGTKPAKYVVNLPSSEEPHSPVPSLDVIRFGNIKPDIISPTQWTLWEIPAISATGWDIFSILRSLGKLNMRGVALGTSLLFWMRVVQFAINFVAKQEVKPALQEVRREKFVHLTARWKPLWTEAAEDTCHALAQSMPGICSVGTVPSTRAFPQQERGGMGETDLESPPPHAEDNIAYEFVKSFIEVVVDACVRDICSNTTRITSIQKDKLTKLVKTTVKWQSWVREWQQLEPLWWNDLISQDNLLSRCTAAIGQPAPLEKLHNFAKAWSNGTGDPVPVIRQSPFRLWLELNDPAPTEGTQVEDVIWTLNIQLRLADDPTTIIPAAGIWSFPQKTLVVSHHALPNPQQYLIEQIGEASRIFAPLAECFAMPFPLEVSLTTAQAYSFLGDKSKALEEAGFGITLPAWWGSQQCSIGAVLHIMPKLPPDQNSPAQSPEDLDYPCLPSDTLWCGTGSIMNYNWKIALGDDVVTREEFRRLVKKNLPLIFWRGRWLELNARQKRDALTLLNWIPKTPPEMTLGMALRMGFGSERLPEGLRVTQLEAEGAAKVFLDDLAQNKTVAKVPPPSEFVGEMRPYQVTGLSWLHFLRQYQFGACLADDMGLGKTIEIIALLLADKAPQDWAKASCTHLDAPPVPGNTRPSLVICPMSIVGNWHRELQRFGPSLHVLIHHGSSRKKDQPFAQKVRDVDVVITTFALVHRDAEDILPIAWNFIIVDEAQNIKNARTKQARAIKSLTGVQRIALTGTPVENRLLELWSIMDFLNPGYLGSVEEFHTTFERPIAKEENSEQAATLKKIIQPFILRRLKTDKTIIKDLPEKMEIKSYCNITAEQASLYQGLVDVMVGKIEVAEGIERKGLILATLVKLKQVCDHPNLILKSDRALGNRSGKLTRLEEMLEEVLDNQEKALVFTQFVQMGHYLQQHLGDRFGCEVLFLHGSTSRRQREDMIRKFQDNSGTCPIFVLSLKAGGYGLNLTAANHVFHFDRWWNPAVEVQATDRTYRIGQTKNVQEYKIICSGTLEERIDEMIEQKRNLVDRIIGSGENWITELSTDQLKNIFSLRRDELGEETI